MPGLGASAISLADYDTGLNVVTFDVDPLTYDPFSVIVRGSSMKALDGGVVHQFFGVNTADYVIQMTGYITEYDTLKALVTKYRSGGGGAIYKLTDFYTNIFKVIFSPGIESFHPIYVPGACQAHTYSMTFNVLGIDQFVNGAY